MLESLSAYARTTVAESAAFLGYDGGLLTLTVRNEHARLRVREQLRNVDFTQFFLGFRNIEIRLGESGTTGRELRAADDDRRRIEAQAAAESSPLLKQLKELFGATLESVEPAPAPVRDSFVVDTDEDQDEQSV